MRKKQGDCGMLMNAKNEKNMNLKNAKTGNVKKGFVITLSSLGFIVILIAFASTLHDNYLSMERALAAPRPLLYAAFIFDDVAYDLNEITGPEIALEWNTIATRVLMGGSVPAGNYTSALADYEALLEGRIGNETHSNISADFSNLSSGFLRLWVAGDYVYANDVGVGGAGETNEMIFRAESGGTGASGYEINVSVMKARTGIESFIDDPDGDVLVEVTYTDLNGTHSENAKLKSNGVNTFRVDYEGGGRTELGMGICGGGEGALCITTQNASASFSFVATLPAAGAGARMGYCYDAVLAYSQGDAAKRGRVCK